MARKSNGWAAVGKFIVGFIAVVAIAFLVTWIVGWAWKGMVNPIEFIKSWVPVAESSTEAAAIVLRPVKLLC